LREERIKTCNPQPKTFFKNYAGDIKDALRSSKIKVGSCQNHPTCPEIGKHGKIGKIIK
jgi:hypothetical protein